MAVYWGNGELKVRSGARRGWLSVADDVIDHKSTRQNRCCIKSIGRSRHTSDISIDRQGQWCCGLGGWLLACCLVRSAPIGEALLMMTLTFP